MTEEQSQLAQRAVEILRAIKDQLRDAAHVLDEAGAEGIAREVRELVPGIDERIAVVEMWEDHYP